MIGGPEGSGVGRHSVGVGVGDDSCDARLGRFTVEHSTLTKRSTVPIPNTSANEALLTFLPCLCQISCFSLISFLFGGLWPIPCPPRGIVASHRIKTCFVMPFQRVSPVVYLPRDFFLSCAIFTLTKTKDSTLICLATRRHLHSGFIRNSTYLFPFLTCHRE